MKLLLGIVIMVSCFPSPAAVVSRGTLYEKDSKRKTTLFEWKREDLPAAAMMEFTSPDGKVAVREELKLENGNVAEYSVDHLQTGEKGAVKVQGRKLHFTYTAGGQTKTDEEDLEPNFVVGPTLVEYLRKHRASLLSGED